MRIRTARPQTLRASVAAQNRRDPLAPQIREMNRLWARRKREAGI